ncbi:hypothetical protein DENSPDRAFT_845828 [Dentipellis sp. KUC8613]|nr:hypothetical protein DENSPDRAFT_845828 [Dentipellis sp. KUC8613]
MCACCHILVLRPVPATSLLGTHFLAHFSLAPPPSGPRSRTGPVLAFPLPPPYVGTIVLLYASHYFPLFYAGRRGKDASAYSTLSPWWCAPVW